MFQRNEIGNAVTAALEKKAEARMKTFFACLGAVWAVVAIGLLIEAGLTGDGAGWIALIVVAIAAAWWMVAATFKQLRQTPTPTEKPKA